jgi:opacity protein-like surface antigen
LYLTGGIGYYGSREIVSDFLGGTQEGPTDWNVGLNVGLGYYLPLSGFTVNFEGRYTHIFSSPNSQGLLPITVGIVF